MMMGALFLARAAVAQEALDGAVWNVPGLLAAPPKSEVGASDDGGLTTPVWYEGEAFQGRPTRIFAWLGRPKTDAGAKSPALLLVHGGGGRAFRDWAKHWAERGYVALAMDTAGQGPDGTRHGAAGPDQSDGAKFAEFDAASEKDMWTYHAVAAVLRGHALLKSLPEVDAGRVGITGISWGGYLTCLTAGIDPELKVAVPVYGCGFLGYNSYWRDRSLAAMSGPSRTRWLRRFDPGTTVGGTRCPILFLNGTHDFAYPPDSYRKTYSLVPPELRTTAVRVELAHGHIWNFGEVDAFVDSVLRPGPEHPPLVRLGDTVTEGGEARADISPGTQPTEATLHVTTDTGTWQRRQWKDVPATVKDGTVTAPLPADRPLTFFFTCKDARGLVTSSSYAEAGASDNTATQPVGKLEPDFYDFDRRHAEILRLGPQKQPEVVLIGDSITHLWGGEPAEPRGNRGADSWKSLFGDRPVLNLGFGWDRTQNVLWRLANGELGGLSPKLAVIHIGTNNLAGTKNARANTPQEIAEGIEAVLLQTKARCPQAKVVLMAVMPRGEKPDDPARAKVVAINALLPEIAKSAGAVFLDIGPQLTGPDGVISRETMPDFLHLGPAGYAVWAEALRPHLP